MSSSPDMSSTAATSVSSAKPDFHPALVVTNIKNSIPFVLEMEKDHYTMWAELFEVHVRAHKVLDHIIPQPGKEKHASTDASFEMWTTLDSTVLQWIYSTISHDLLTTIMEKGFTAMAVWKRLADHFEERIHCHGCHGVNMTIHCFINIVLIMVLFFRFSCPHTSSQNDKAERKIRTISNMIRTLLAHSSVPLSFWHHALQMATYLLNILPRKNLSNHSPTQLLYHCDPLYIHFRVFGCLCYPLFPSTTINKLQPCSTLCVFLGYPP